MQWYLFFTLIFYTYSIYSEQNNPSQQPSVQITIHAETQSGLDQNNNLDQNAKHASSPITDTTTAIQQNQNLQTQESDEGVPLTVFKYTAGYACPPCALAYYLYQKSTRK